MTQYSIREIIGQYVRGGGLGGDLLILNADGVFTQNSSGCTYHSHISGTYEYSEGGLSFRLLTVASEEYGPRGKRIVHYDPADNIEWTTFNMGGVKRAIRLFPVKWRERMYLIEATKLKLFEKAVASGFESHSKLLDSYYSQTFYLRVENEEKTICGDSALPGT